MAHHNHQQHHLHPPRLCFQIRSLSARENAVDEEAHQFGAFDDDWSNTVMAAKTRERQLSASSDQLLTECFRQNVSLMPFPRPQHHRILPSPPSPIGDSDRGDEAQKLIGNGTNRYRKRSGNQRKKNDMTELRRKEFREKAGKGQQQWRSTVYDADDTSAVTDEAQQQLLTISGNNGFGGGLKSRLAFTLFGLGKSADTERDKAATTTKHRQQQQQRRRSLSAAVTACNQQQQRGFSNNGTAPSIVPILKRKTTAETTTVGVNNLSQMGTTKRISNAAQQLILSCLDKSRGDLSGRILSRAIHKRPDFSKFCANLSTAEKWTNFAEQFHKYVADVLGSLQNVEQIRVLSMRFGAEQVNRRVYGFKADFFAAIANSLATECVFLDGASHSPTDAIEAWAELVEVMFSSVRDGYYAEVRRKRRCSCAEDTKFGQISKTEKA